MSILRGYTVSLFTAIVPNFHRIHRNQTYTLLAIVKPIISVAHTDTKFYYQSAFHFSPTKDLALFVYIPHKNRLLNLHTKWHLDPSSRLVTTHGPKIGGCAPFGGSELGPHLTQSRLGRGYTSIPSSILIHPAVWPQRTWAENWPAVPHLGEGAGFSSNTMWPGPRPTSAPSFILIHRTVCPQ